MTCWLLVIGLCFIYLPVFSNNICYLSIFFIIDLLYFFSKTTVKPVLSSHSKIHKNMIVMTNSGLMEFERTAECNTFDLH